jgi:hypothetical protein
VADLLDVFEQMPSPDDPVDDRERRRIIDALGSVGERHRRNAAGALEHGTIDVPHADLSRLCLLAGAHLEGSLRRARRDDGLYDSYNMVSFPSLDTARVRRLGPMLEGQVAVLSSGVLSAADALSLIDRLFASDLYSTHHGTFLLYPAVELPAFVERNTVPVELLERVVDRDGEVVDALRAVLAADRSGRVHFRADAVNGRELDRLLDRADVSSSDRAWIRDVYEQVFRHDRFTGRSGRMHGYEGIGSVYWHMVGKLLVAVQETYWSAVTGNEPARVVDRLAQAYRRVRAGLGFVRQPGEFGAFPIDCYSHTPTHAGAQQPGMTGQVKEEVLTRSGEIGLLVVDGRVSLRPGLIALPQLIPPPDDGGGGTAWFTFCSVPMTMVRGGADGVEVHRPGGVKRRDGLDLDADESRGIFRRDGSVERVAWTIGPGRPTDGEAAG